MGKRRTKENGPDVLTPFDESDDKHGGLQTAPAQRYRVYKTLCIYMSTAWYGVLVATIGPTLLNLEVLMDTNLGSLSLALMAKGIGFLVGSLLVGLVLDIINHELFFCLSTCTLAIFAALAPSTNVYGFIVSMFITGGMGSVLAAGGQAYILPLWEGTKWTGPTTQALHSTFSIGAMLGPLLAKPFLVELASTESLTTVAFNDSGMTLSSISKPEEGGLPGFDVTHAGEEPTVSYVSESSFTHLDLSSVRYPYFIIGGINLLGSLCFLAVLIKEHKPILTRKKPKEVSSDGNESSCLESLSWFSTILLILFFFCQCFYATQEQVPGNFLPMLVIKHLGWEVTDGASISAVYFGSFLAGRLFGIPLSMFLQPTVMLLLSLPLTTCGFLLMCFVPYLPTAYTYTSVAFVAFVMASSTPTLYLWMSNYMVITGRAAAFVTAGYSIGDLVWQPITAYLLETVSPMFVVYIPFTASIVELLLFGILNVIVKCCPVPVSQNVISYRSVVEVKDSDHIENNEVAL